MRYYPVHLDLKGRKVVVVGGGTVALRKIRSLLEAGAKVTVIDSYPLPSVKRLAGQKRLHWVRRDYRKGDLKNAFAAIAATNDPNLHRTISREARIKKVILNVVDQPRYCNFVFPSVLRRGEFMVTVSTGGGAPALAKEVRKTLEGQFGPEYGRFVKEMSSLRRRLPPGLKRQKLMKEFAKRMISKSTKRKVKA